jgi:DNA-binding IclR family transcriptional regulator
MKGKNVKAPPMPKGPEAENKAASDKARRQFITALARGLDVLRAFHINDQQLSNRELARRTGLPKPTISRITYTLTELGFLTYLEQFGCYELGGSTLVLGHVARSNFDGLAKARPAMERLAKNTGCSVGLGTRDQVNMVYLVSCQGPALIGLRFDVGARIPIISTAMGRAFVAACPDDERNKLIKKLKADPSSNEKKVDWVVEHAGRELAANGYCISAGEWHADIHGAAVPISSNELGGLFVLNCGAPAYLLPHERLVNEIGPALLKAAQEIKLAVGAVEARAISHVEDAGGPATRAQSIKGRAPSGNRVKPGSVGQRPLIQPGALRKPSRRPRARA